MPFYKSFIILTLFLSSTKVNAQLTANFTPNQTAGCNPLTVSFKNTTTGASSSAVYVWDFGNGNKVTNSNTTQTATYINEQTYTVTLTVTDGGVQSQKSVNITVYNSPVTSFMVSDSVGCTPFTTTYTSNSTSQSGAITSYYWDLGDGNTINGDSTDQTVSHTYTFPGRYNVKLNIKTAAGCTSKTLAKDSIVNVLLSPTASYSRNKTYLCQPGDNVTFTNNSFNTQNATYFWDFGNGNTSAAISPTNVYGSKGTFHDSLIVTNANGCADTSIFAVPLYSASFQSSFTDTGLCAATTINFINTSIPVPDSSVWSFSNQASPVSGINATNQFASPGTYQVQVINTFGNCKDTLSNPVTIIPPITLPGFLVANAPVCGKKTLVSTTDTSSGSVAWVWNLQGTNDTINTQTANFTLANDSLYIVSLTVTKSTGCSASTLDTVVLPAATVSIKTVTNDSLSNTSGCTGLTVQFSATPANGIKTYLWNFGDGTPTSSDSAPTHNYNNVGIYPVELIYTTQDGCMDTVWLKNIQVYSKPQPAFTTTNTINCGSKAYFYDQTPGSVTGWSWNFGDTLLGSTKQNPVHDFHDTGYFSVTLTAYNGTCIDSVTYTHYIDILPPFQHIDTIEYPCAGVRDTANFFGTYFLVQSGTWNFGDSSPLVNLDTNIHELYHVYPKTGTYMAILSATNAQCTTYDTAWVHILLNQHPRLYASDSVMCENDSVKMFIDTSTLQVNPGSSDSNYYSVYKWQYGNISTAFSGVLYQQPNWYYSYLGILKGLTPGQTQLRLITQSEYYGCYDTTNYINLQVKGPIVDYNILNPMSCFRLPMSFVDNSLPTFNVPIVQWIWGFGDGTIDTATTGATVTHYYSIPGQFEDFLKVTDHDGCFAQANSTDTARPSGPKADFIWKPAYIVVGTTDSFLNRSNTYEDNKVIYQWSFTSDGLTATTRDVVNSYTTSLIDTVTLIATAPQNGCADTLVRYVPVKQVFALFDIKTKYINNNNCPPLIVYLTSHSINADMIRWDFGDGSPGSGIVAKDTASYTYNLPGVYVITLYAYRNSSPLPMDSTSDTITISGAYAKIQTNITQGCVPTTVTFTSKQTNVATFSWDFGDGDTLKNSNNTSVLHKYTSAGSYTPYLVLTDNSGCVSSFALPNKILIDSLHAFFVPNKTPICDSATVTFFTQVYDFAASTENLPVSYHWAFNMADPADTSDLPNPTHYYKLGKYAISQTVTSAVGCVENYTDTISVVPSDRGSIAGPIKVCDSIPATFTGTPKTPIDSVKWYWSFGNGDTSLSQNPNPIYFITGKDTVTTDSVMLVTELNNCLDTAYTTLIINPKPVTALQLSSKTICMGNNDTLSVHDGAVYSWNQKFVRINNADSVISVTPSDTTFYKVTATNQYGCMAGDSVTINVVPYITLAVPPTMYVCKGQSTQLPVSGADSYVWLADSATINAKAYNSSNPSITPIDSLTIYEVKGFNSCFDTTKDIEVFVEQYPTVVIPSPGVVLTGDSVTLETITSSDVTSYLWTPGTYLNCTDCAFPECAPRLDTSYTVTVKNQYGCAASAGVAVHLLCSQSLYVPNAFVPESQDVADNRIFYPKGKGVRSIRRMTIFNRLGQVVFQRENFQMNDRTAGWDGTVNGVEKAPPGAYVYTIDAQCDSGTDFPLQGTVVLIR